MDNRIKYIADYYGFTSQADMLIEESAEFIQAVCKLHRGNENEYAHIKEELADVLVCAEQYTTAMLIIIAVIVGDMPQMQKD